MGGFDVGEATLSQELLGLWQDFLKEWFAGEELKIYPAFNDFMEWLGERQ